MRNILKLAILSLVISHSSAVFAEDVKVDKIQVNGNKRVEASTIEAFLNITPGQTVSKDQLDGAFRRMYDTGLFADLKLAIKNGVLVVDIQENPTVSEVEITGNEKISTDKITPELKVAVRSVYKESDVQADVKRILTLYQRSGRFNVKVDPKTEDLGDGKMKVTYKVDEGKRASVNKISFIGNKAFSGGELRSVVSTKESAWYRFFSGNDVYDPDRLDYDKELVRRYYVQRGYADVKVVSADAEYNEPEQSFNIVFNVEEGAHYNFGKIDIDSSIADITLDQVKESLKTKEGKEFNSKKVEDTVSALTDVLGDKGYAFVRIDPQFKKDGDNVMDIKYAISEGSRVYINKININGNTRTTDEVIRREFRIAEGDPYNSSKLKRSKQRVEALGFFSKVDMENEPTDQADKVNVNVKVAEQSTGELTFGAGFSSADGALADVSVTERNLLGKGQFLKASITAASSRKEADLSFTEPYFMDRNLAAGFDIFNTITSRDGSGFSNYTFDNETKGVTLRGTYPLTEFVDHTLRYTIRDDKVSNPDPLASVYVLEQIGQRTSSLVGQTISFNNLDNQFSPKAGWLASISQDAAGLGGDVKYLKHEAKVSYFTPLSDSMEEWIWKLSGRAGEVSGLGGEDVKINDRFFIGGSVIRGFDNQGIGARDKTSRDPLGGNTYYAASSELMFPVGLPEELGVKGAVFADAATLYGVDTALATTNIKDNSSLRTSSGVGVFWRSPVGPIRVDFAKALSKESYDQDQFFRFSFGTKF